MTYKKSCCSKVLCIVLYGYSSEAHDWYGQEEDSEITFQKTLEYVILVVTSSECSDT
jgi:hypothetical protein